MMTDIKQVMTNLEHALYKRLYRGDCPSAETLHNYYWHNLTAEAVAKTTEHLAICPDCATEYADLSAFLAPEYKKAVAPAPLPSEQSWLSELPVRVSVVVARLKSAVGAPQRGHAALRGDTSRQNLMYETDNEQIVFLNWWQDERAYFTLSGSLFPPPPDGVKAVAHLQMMGEGEVGASADLDPMGEFVFANLDAGTYQLVIQSADKQVLVPYIEIATQQ